MRCFFEPVMTPYHLAPPLIVAARMDRMRFGMAALFALGDTVFAYYRFTPWVWRLPVAGMVAVVLACGYPGRHYLVADGVIAENNRRSFGLPARGVGRVLA
jgi:hypothetical protein